MKFKKVFFITLVILLSASLLSAAYYKKPVKKSNTGLSFVKGSKYVTAQIGLYSGVIPFGANFELAMTENIGVGATMMVWFGDGITVFMPSVEAAYHFTMLEVDKLDLYAGAGIGFAVASGGGTSGLALTPFIAARYWFSDNLGISLKENFGLTGYTGAFSMLGVVFRI
jgi:hypothetical protein